MAVSISRLFATSVREIVPRLTAADLSYTFAEKGDDWQLDEGKDPAADELPRTFHRLYSAASDMLSHGFMAFDLALKPQRAGGCALRLRIGGTGQLKLHGRIPHTLRQLMLSTEDDGHAGEPRLQRAHGVCPASGARVDFACLPLAGFMFSASCSLRQAHLDDESPAPAPTPPSPPSPSPRMWLVHADAVNAASVGSQAQHHGWAVAPMKTFTDAVRRARHHPLHQAWPALVIVFVDTLPALAATTAADLATLRQLLPPQVLCVAAAETGSPWLGDPEALRGYELHCHPLCRGEWESWSAKLMPGADVPSGLTQPAPLEPAGRVPVLVVDDDHIYRFLTEKLLGAMGYAVHTAQDGQQAIDACRRLAPALVLMDLDMPVLDGYEATRRLRELQRSGEVQPSRIVAHSGTSDATAQYRAALAGADGFLPKPARLQHLRAEVLRWCTAHHAVN